MSDPIKEILLIHHSHTDIGYTAQQSVVARWNVDFVRRALTIAKDNPDFRWTSETFWGVEQFLGVASEQERRVLADAVRSSNIGLSASYLNFNELLDYDILHRMTGRATSYGSRFGVPIDSAMTADINGFGWGFARALEESGVDNLLTCIHTHHGMFPLGQRHIPFWWETPSGNRILVFSAEHYHYGNELGLVPGAVSSYTIKDECDAAMIFGDHWKVAEIRLPRFIEQLTISGYDLPIVPVMASGLRTDNGPPNEAILHAVERWNQAHSDLVTIRMVTLSEFFHELRSVATNIETFRGDWPDWWSDGLASVPADTYLFREAQRCYQECLRLLGEQNKDSSAIETIRQDLALYAEHTFSHADSVSRPWGLDIKGIAARKVAYAAGAYDTVTALLNQQYEKMGQVSLRPDAASVFKVVNDWNRRLVGFASLHVGHYEYHELGLDHEVVIRNCHNGHSIPHQRRPAPAGMEFVVPIDLAGRGELELEIVPGLSPCQPPDERPAANSLITPKVQINWAKPDGIIGWYDTATDQSLIQSDAPYPPFTPIYEITPGRTPDKMCQVRGEMGLNRKGAEVERSVGQLTRSQQLSDGPQFTEVELEFDLLGTSLYRVVLTVFMHLPRVDVRVQIIKDQVWSPENIYLALPFGPGSRDFTIWLDKAGQAVRPRIDQLPGTLTDFYCIQEGLALVDQNFGIAIATPDSPLVHLGDLAYRDRRLHENNILETNQTEVYSWLMTNYWETNFAAGLGGFYEFRYAVSWGSHLADQKEALNWCRTAFSGLHTIRTGRQGG